MREGIGSVFLYNIIIIFIVITFAFLMAIMSYAKAFRVNSKIIKAIENYEGYNVSAASEISRVLNNYGYMKGSVNCSERVGKESVKQISVNGQQYQYCVYAFVVDTKHYNYGVLTYMYIDLPVIGEFLRFPVFTKTDVMYYFTNDGKKISEWIE